MTRNNLADQVAWLLRNTSSSRPAVLSFPSTTSTSTTITTTYTSSSRPSQTRLSSSAADPNEPQRSGQSFHTSQQAVDRNPRPLSPVLSNTLSSPRPARNAIPVTAAVGHLEDGNMGRLTSSTSRKKPTLVSRQQPSSLSSSNTVPQSSGAKGRTSISKAQAPAPTPTPASRHVVSSTFNAEFPDFNTQEWECMDLTDEPVPSSESLNFDDLSTVWGEDETLRPEPLPASSGQKRKREVVSKDEVKEDETEFPDVYELLGTKPPPATPASRASKRQRDGTRSQKRSCIRDSVHRSGRSNGRESGSADIAGRMTDEPSSPLGPKSRRVRHTPSRPTPPKAIPPSSKTPRRTPTPSARELPVVETVDDDVFDGLDDEKIIPDSDDEFMTPPSHTTSIARPLEREKPPQSSEVIDLADDSTISLAESHEADSTAAASKSKSPDSDQYLGVLNRLVSAKDALKNELDHVATLIQQNGRIFMEAINNRAKKDKRDEIKAEKERLLKQQETLKGLSKPLQAYQNLCMQRETLAKQVSESYANGLDTDEDELQLDKLTDDIQEVERQLVQSMAQERLDKASLSSKCQDPSASSRPRESDPVGSRDQPLGHFTVNMAATDSTLGSSSTSGNFNSTVDVVHQTQLPPQTKLWNQPIGSSGTPSRTRLMPQDDQRSHEALFPPQSQNSGLMSRPGRGVGDRTHMDLANFDAEYAVEQELLQSDLDDLDIAPKPRSSKKPKAPSHLESAKKSRNQLAPEDFSDFSDDEEMLLAFAQDYETQQQSLRSGSQASRRILNETSGNAASVPAAKLKKTSSTVPQVAPEQSIPPHLMKHPWSPDVQRILKERFRMRGFRHNQLEAINATLAAEDAFVLMPTGGGKSLCYQLPAVIKSGKTKGVTIVVSPLLSLMQDQVNHMKALGIQAVAFNSECSAEYKKQVMSAFNERAPENYVELLYVTPEMISKSIAFSDAMDSLYRKRKFARLVIDEAHCVSQWGHDFRPDYKTIGQLRHRFPEVPIMALTATATQNVIVDIKHNLGLVNCRVFSQSFNRPNLFYEVRPKTTNISATHEIAKLIKEKYSGVSGIVYTISRKQAEDVAEKLYSEYGIRADHYHGKVETEQKVAVQTGWQKGEIQVVVATIAFGMGIDKPDVRFVVHHGLPKSLEGYYQETGRAGRDGKPSDCILYYSKADIRVLKRMISDGEGGPEQKERQMVMFNRVTAFCDNQADCRRTEVLRYFGEDFTPAQCRKTCDNCKLGLVFEQKDYSATARAALGVIDAQGRITANQCADILQGKSYPPNVQPLSDNFRGTAKGTPRHEIVRVIDKLFSEKALDEINQVSRYGVAIQYLQTGPMARAFLAGQRQLLLSVPVSAKGSDTGKSKPSKAKKKDKAKAAPAMQSTYVSSPVNRRGHRNRMIMGDDDDDDDDDDDEEEGGAYERNSRGYANDGFVVPDDEVDMDDDDGAFDDLPAHRPARPPTKTVAKKLAKPVPVAQRLEKLSDIHQDLVNGFVTDARKLEEQIRNKKELRRPLFTEQDLREMAVSWTMSLDTMSRIPGIQADKVKEHGPKMLAILRRYHHMYEETCVTSSNRDEDVVNLVSSDGELDDEDVEAQDDEDSHYFSNNNNSRPEVQAFHNRLQSLAHNGSATTSNPRASSSSSWKRGGGARGGKKSYPKRAARKASGGAAPGRRRGGGGGGGSYGGNSRKASGSSAASSGQRRDGKIVKKSGGGIGLMPL